MPQQFLHYLDIRSLCPQESRIGVAERMPADPPTDAELHGRGPYDIAHLGGHPKPAIEGHLKTGHSDTSKVDLDAGQKTPGVVAALTPDASCNRASPKVTGHIREIVREQVTSLETTEAGKNHQVFGQSRWPVLE